MHVPKAQQVTGFLQRIKINGKKRTKDFYSTHPSSVYEFITRNCKMLGRNSPHNKEQLQGHVLRRRCPPATSDNTVSPVQYLRDQHVQHDSARSICWETASANCCCDIIVRFITCWSTVASGTCDFANSYCTGNITMHCPTCEVM